MKKLWLLIIISLVSLAGSILFGMHKAVAASASYTYVPYPVGGPSPYDGNHWMPFCGPQPASYPGPPNPNIYKQFDRCSNESYYFKRPLFTQIFSNGTWIWDQGHDGTPRPNITSANGNNVNDMRGFVNVVRNDLYGANANRGYNWLVAGTCTATNHTEYGRTLPGILWCDVYSSTIIGASSIVNTMLGMGGDDAAFRNQAAYNKYCPGSLSIDLRINGINIAKCRFNEWWNLVNYYAAQPVGSTNGYINWSETKNYSDAADGVIDGYGPLRTDTVVFRETIGYGLANRPTIDSGFYINDAVGNPSDRYIVFHNPDGTSFSINKNCGNITGPASGLTAAIPYLITPSASKPVLLPSSESPTSIRFDSTFMPDVDLSGSSTNITASLTYTINGVTFATDTHTLSAAEKKIVSTPLSITKVGFPPLSVGDLVCQTLRINPGKGSYNSSTGVITPDSTNAQTSSTSCATVINRPYLSVYGGDIIAGGSIDDGSGCSATVSSPIATFLNTATNAGSGSQLAAFATNQIAGFASAKLRSPPVAAPNPKNGLSFANVGAGTPGTFGLNNCITGYEMDTTKPAPPAGNIAAWADGAYYVNGNYSGWPGSGGINPGQRIVLYVKGDFTIDQSGTGIFYKNTNTWSTPDDIPSLTVIVAGNIYIDRSVNTLDGVYVAYPNGGVGGNIYTCTNGSTKYTLSSDLINLCNTKLTIHGSLIAKNIKWLRTKNSLRDASPSEQPYPTLGPSGTNAAEEVLFDQEVYLSKPALPKLSETGGGTQFDSITSLPPVL